VHSSPIGIGPPLPLIHPGPHTHADEVFLVGVTLHRATADTGHQANGVDHVGDFKSLLQGDDLPKVSDPRCSLRPLLYLLHLFQIPLVKGLLEVAADNSHPPGRLRISFSSRCLGLFPSNLVKPPCVVRRVEVPSLISITIFLTPITHDLPPFLSLAFQCRISYFNMPRDNSHAHKPCHNDDMHTAPCCQASLKSHGEAAASDLEYTAIAGFPSAVMKIRQAVCASEKNMSNFSH